MAFDLVNIINKVYTKSAVSTDSSGKVEIKGTDTENSVDESSKDITDDKPIDFSMKDNNKIDDEKFNDLLGNGIAKINTEEELSLFSKDFESYVATNYLNFAQRTKVDNEINAKNHEFEIEQTEKENSIDKGLKDFEKSGKNLNSINVWDIKQVANLEKQRKYLNDFENIKKDQLNLEA